MTVKGRLHPLGGGIIINANPVRFDPLTEENGFQEYKVPAGVKKLLVECVGARGFNGGKGGKVKCVLSVKPRQMLYLFVGKYPTGGRDNTYNASDIRTSAEGLTDETSLNNRLVVAGAGGNYIGGYGPGDGGDLVAGQGSYDIISTGGPGTQTAGGSHSYNIRGSIRSAEWGSSGEFGKGGSGPACGGGGWYGGGSGGTADVSKVGGVYSGGGGGSSHTDEELCSEVEHTRGFAEATGDGWIVLTPITK